MKWIFSIVILSALMAFSTTDADKNNVCADADVIVPSSLYADKTLQLKVQDVSDFTFQLYDWEGTKVFQALVDVTYLPQELKNNIHRKSIDMGSVGNKDMQGSNMKAGNYIYIIEATCISDYHFRREGNLTLIK
ncbi:MAG: hypothetical protein GY810_12905 [Aureispira sp.]|nr:hypothetical protein [Aureispira sp.]